MRTLMLLLSAILAFSFAQAQDISKQTAYRSLPIPDFSLLKTDGTYYAKKDLPKGQYVLMILFSPDCEHCRQETRKIQSKMKSIKNTTLVMATFMQMEGIRKFEKEFELKKYKNIQLGRDSRYLLAPFYNIKNVPFFALYDPSGKFMKDWSQELPIDQLIKLLP
jgi:thioredoxin-related protein